MTNDLIAKLEKALETKADIVTVLKRFTQEMEGYIYYGSNPGVPEDDYDEVATEIGARRRPLIQALVECVKALESSIKTLGKCDQNALVEATIYLNRYVLEQLRRAVEGEP